METYLRDERTQIQKDNELTKTFKSIKEKYENPKKTYLNFRNNLIMILKNESRFKLLFKLPVRFLIDLFASLFHLISKKSLTHFMSVLKAYIFIIIRIPYFLFNNRNLIRRKSFEDEIIIPIKYGRDLLIVFLIIFILIYVSKA